MNATVLDNGGPDDDIFGSSRSYGSSFCGGNGGAIVAKARPTMISAKYRLKEERRKVLKISINKLKKIEDMESSLRRSVLINNTIKRLQREAKEEKLQKQQLHSYPRCYTPYKTSNFSKDSSGMITSLASKSLRQDMPNDADKENTSQNTSRNSRILSTESRDDTLLMATELDMSQGCDEEVANLSPSTDCTGPVSSKKRPIEEVEDCDVQDVLSQFYMPPTPRMLTSIDDTDDEDEDVNVVDIDVPPCTPATPDCCKRPKLETSDVKTDVPPVVCERLCLDERTLPDDAGSLAKSLEDSDDIEVVLEDKEDVERRLLLCSGGTAISRATVLEDSCWVNSRTNTGGSSCTLLPSPSDMLVEDDCRVDAPDPSLRLSCSDASLVLLPAQSDVLSEHDTNITRLSGASSLSSGLSSPTGMDMDDSSATNHPVLHTGCVPTCNIQPPSTNILVKDNLPASVNSLSDLRLCYSVPSNNVVPTQPELLVPNAAQSCERLRLESSASPCAMLPSSPTDIVLEESAMIGASKHQALRLGSSPFVANSFCEPIDGGAVGSSSVSSCPMALDPTEQHQYSCGHASIFGELQSVVFHSLIASLES